MTSTAYTPRVIISLLLLAIACAVLVTAGSVRGSQYKNIPLNTTKVEQKWHDEEPYLERVSPSKIPKRGDHGAQKKKKDEVTTQRMLKPKQTKTNPIPPPRQPKGGRKGFNGGLGDWALCAISYECGNGCCSNFFSGDGRFRCTPLEGGFRSDLCVVTPILIAPTSLPVPTTNPPFTAPTFAPVPSPTIAPVPAPTIAPIPAPTIAPVPAPTIAPVPAPTIAPTIAPVPAPTIAPTIAPVPAPTIGPTIGPSGGSTVAPIQPGPQYGLQQDCLQDDQSKFNICLDLGSKSKSYQPWMDSAIAARDRWLQVILADTFPAKDTTTLYPPTDPKTIPEGIATSLPPYIDDIYISIVESDLRKEEEESNTNILGLTGPLFAKKNSAGHIIPYYASIRIDSVDLESMYTTNIVERVLEHEIGHALGFSTGLLLANNLISDLPGDYTYKGQYAQDEWKAIGCSGDLPVALDPKTGTAEGHWDEACLNEELMTPSVDYGTSKYRSSLTIGLMKDLGYVVNMGVADRFTLNELSRSQCSDYCPQATGDFSQLTSTSSFLQERNTATAAATEERRVILSAAASELQRRRENRPLSLPEETEYIGGDFITVLTRDSDGRIDGTTVFWEEVEEYLASSVVV